MCACTQLQFQMAIQSLTQSLINMSRNNWKSLFAVNVSKNSTTLKQIVWSRFLEGKTCTS